MTYVFTSRDIAIAVVGFIFPPLGVILREGCGLDLCINILLTILGHLPGEHSLQWHMAWHSACGFNRRMSEKTRMAGEGKQTSRT